MFSNHFNLQVALVNYLDLISRNAVANTESNVICDLAPTPSMIELSANFENTLGINSSNNALDSTALVTTTILPTSGMYRMNLLLRCFLLTNNVYSIR